MNNEPKMLSLRDSTPRFSLEDVVSGENYSLSSFKEKKELLVMFICRHCPYVKNIESGIVKLGNDYKDKDVAIVAISSNDPERVPEDAPKSLAEQAKEKGFSFPYLFDADQSVARAFTAQCTPEFFLFDEERKLVYRGQFDDSRPGNGKEVTGRDLRDAIDALISGGSIDQDQTPSTGCSIKWKQ